MKVRFREILGLTIVSVSGVGDDGRAFLFGPLGFSVRIAGTRVAVFWG